MRDRTEAEIDDLVARFERQAVSEAEWRHREHQTVALAYLLARGLPATERALREGIQALNAALGGSGYHETLTVAWCRKIAAWLGEQPPDLGRAALAAKLARDLDKTALRAHYTRERIHTDAARRGWVEPDRAPILVGGPEASGDRQHGG